MHFHPSSWSPSRFVLSLALFLLVHSPALSQQVVNLPEGDRPVAVEEEVLYSVGSVAGEDWESFSTITALAFDEAGNLYILDRQNFRVVKVAPDGHLVTEMGRSGGGPGEFGMPLTLSVTRGGEVRVFDMGQQGFSVFNPDASFQRIVRGSGEEFFIPNGGLMSLPDGSMVDGGPAPTRMTLIGASDDANGPRPVHRITLAEHMQVTNAYEGWNPLAAQGGGRESTVTAGGFQVTSTPMRAFDPELLVGALPDGRLAIADSTAYSINLVGPDGSILTTLRRPFSPRKVTRRDQAAERERQMDRITAREESGGSGRAMTYGGSVSGGSGGSGATSIAVGSGQVSELLRARVEGMEFGDEVPVLAGMAVDWEGRIWVERTGDRVGEKGPIDLIDPDGGYVGTIAPDRARIPDAFGPGGFAAFLETDELDVPRVVVKKIRVR